MCKWRCNYKTTNLRWLLTKGKCTPRYLLPISFLKKRCLCGMEPLSITIYAACLNLGILSNIHKMFVTSQIKTFWDHQLHSFLLLLLINTSQCQQHTPERMNVEWLLTKDSFDIGSFQQSQHECHLKSGILITVKKYH